MSVNKTERHEMMRNDTISASSRQFIFTIYINPDLILTETTHEHGEAPCSFSDFLNSSVERLSLIFLGRLFQRILPRNKSEFVQWRDHMGKNIS